MKVKLTRTFENEKQTIGTLHVIKNNRVIFTCQTLELPWRDNKKRVSCIPKGTYKLKKRESPKFGMCFIVQKVPDRSFILIHGGNRFVHTLGCILPGSHFKDINKDGIVDVVNSKRQVSMLLDILPDVVDIEIV